MITITIKNTPKIRFDDSWIWSGLLLQPYIDPVARVQKYLDAIKP